MDLHAELVRLKAAPELPEWIVGAVQSLIDQAQEEAAESARLSEPESARRDTALHAAHTEDSGPHAGVGAPAPDALRREQRGALGRVLAEGPAEQEGPFFIGTPRSMTVCHSATVRCTTCFRDLRQQLGWGNRGAHHARRIHDLRHTFVVRRIVQWQAQGVDIDQAMLSLST